VEQRVVGIQKPCRFGNVEQVVERRVVGKTEVVMKPAPASTHDLTWDRIPVLTDLKTGCVPEI
jgi:hypothetical protein